MPDLKEEIQISDDDITVLNNNIDGNVKTEYYHPRDKANDNVAKNIAKWIFVLLGTIIGGGLSTLVFFSFFDISNDKILDITEKLLISSLTAISGIAGSAVAFYFTYNRNK